MSPFSHSTVTFTNPNSLMSLSSTLRLSSCLLRRSLSHSRNFRFPLSNSHLRRTQPASAVRFFSSDNSRSGKVFAAAKRADEQFTEESGANNGGLVGAGDGNNGDSRIVPFELHKEATDSYMSYALSVLLGRALPDVRDGLKPVHRRILFAMYELGMSSKKPYKKCARVVGEVLGKFHPHGDTAVYDALVRMAQSFSLRCPLIQGHGNFGSIDADPAAAMRYTECRLDPLTEAVFLADLDHDTVDYVANFDNSQKEPSVLPARLPALLLNGASGIAVGMATNIPPHNLGELVDVLCALIHNPEATLQELLEYMPAPDFPTGGIIMGNLGVLDAYRTGRGRVVVRGKAEVELLDPKTKRNAVIITEIPYQTNKATLVQKIAELVENKVLEGISDIRDESDRNGMRVVIELKRGGDPALVLNNLYRHTALQSSFSCNMVGISNGEPKLMGLKELLQEFIEFRCSVVERRARFKLSHAQQRKHIIEGIVVGLDNMDAVIQLIKKSPSHSSASVALQSEYGLSEKQAEAILEISLRRLTALERKKFTDESSSLTEQITKLDQLLSNRTNILKLIEQEAIELKDKFSTLRRSMLEDSDSGDLDDIDVIPNEEMLMAISEKGYVKRMKPDTFSLQHRGTIGKSVGKLRVDDTMSDFLVCHAHDHVLFFSDRGIVYSTRAYKIPECSRNAAGTPLVQILNMSEGERVTSIVPVSEFAEDRYLLMLTVNGCIKKVSLKLFSGIRSTGIIAIQLNSGDELKWVRCCSSDDLVAMASQDGMVVLSSCDIIRSLSRNTKGVTAMRLKEDDKMASMDIIPASLRKNMEEKSDSDDAITVSGKQSTGPWLLFVCENGYGKRVPLSSFRRTRLNRIGLRGSRIAEDDRLAAVFVVGYSLAEDGESDEQVVLVSQSGTVNRIKVRDISIQSRHARGVILMRLDHAGKIQSASLLSAAVEEEEGEGIPSLEEAAASL